jgi:hypothetical protein
MTDEFHIWERLLQQVRNELQNDRDGIDRNLAHIDDLKERNEWLQRRIDQNELAEAALSERVAP